VVREHRFDAFTAFDQISSPTRGWDHPSYGTGRLCEIASRRPRRATSTAPSRS
jgi:hypothetical protein